MIKAGQRYKNKKNKKYYSVFCAAKNVTGNGAEIMVIYCQSNMHGIFYARELKEFEEKFEND